MISIWVIQVELYLDQGVFMILSSFMFIPFVHILVLQQVYMYFRGSGKAAEMRREATRSAVRAAI